MRLNPKIPGTESGFISGGRRITEVGRAHCFAGKMLKCFLMAILNLSHFGSRLGSVATPPPTAVKRLTLSLGFLSPLLSVEIHFRGRRIDSICRHRTM